MQKTQERGTILPPLIGKDMYLEQNPLIRALLCSEFTLDQESVSAYYDVIKVINRLNLGSVSRALIEHLSADPDEVVIAVPGSDGKLEKGPFLHGVHAPSPVELSIFSRNTALNEEITKELLGLINEEGSFPLAVDDRIESKNINGPELLSVYQGNVKHSWPDRVVNAYPVYGSTQMFSETGTKVFQEWQANPAIQDSVKTYLKQFRRTCETGTSRNKVQFNPETGEIFYDASQFVLGLKYGPIRALQVFLTIHQLEKGEQFSSSTNTVDKLLYFFPDAQEVAQAYQMAIRVYHWQQLRAKSGEDATVKLHPSELTHINSVIQRFVAQRKK